MSAISPFQSYRIDSNFEFVYVAVPVALGLAALVVHTIKKCFPSTSPLPLKLSDQSFWERTAQISPSEQRPITINGENSSSFREAQHIEGLRAVITEIHKESHDMMRPTPIIVQLFNCATGTIKAPETLSSLDRTLESLYNPSNILDHVICPDTLPYIPPAEMQKTMQKIFQALRPGGIFFGTLFFQPSPVDNDHIKRLRSLGAHFYPNKEWALEIISRSGFEIQKSSKRRDGGLFSTSHAVEFTAKKPL